MNKLILTITAIAALVSCSQGPATDNTNSNAAVSDQAIERVVTQVATTGDQVSVADLSIAGMSCEMMCGGAIKKKLASLPGVVSTDITFNADEEMDHAIVTYDESKVTDQELANAVGQLHDGQYQVKRVAVERRVKEVSEGSDKEKGSAGRQAKSKKINASIPLGALVPSVIELISQIVRF